VDDATLVGLRVGIGFEIVIDVYTHGTFSIMKCQISQKWLYILEMKLEDLSL
jgi:hypothetical protein